MSLESLDLVLIPSCDSLLLSPFPAVLEEAEKSRRSRFSKLALSCRTREADDAEDSIAEQELGMLGVYRVVVGGDFDFVCCHGRRSFLNLETTTWQSEQG